MTSENNYDKMTLESIYIGSLRQKYTEEDVKAIFSEKCIGEVARVDFVQPGQVRFHETLVPRRRYKSAFIYFHSFTDSEISLEVRRTLDAGYKLFLGGHTHYWLLTRNRHSIPYTQMNIHQVVEYARQLDSIVERQNLEIQSMKMVTNQLILNYNAHIAGILNYLTQLEYQRGGQRLEQLEQIVAQMRTLTLPDEDDKTKSKKAIETEEEKKFTA